MIFPLFFQVLKFCFFRFQYEAMIIFIYIFFSHVVLILRMVSEATLLVVLITTKYEYDQERRDRFDVN